ncbi:TIGR01244 family sulfur transferase [Sphingomonas jaspsi]|uniref:TIGR01244 family sulfur transferase n=1 Tax=Sphingomonas jaspsi TaxID=392409 RepID=UPI0004AFED09|nr:TIGR01244 family sulfur transferase [Sphingomonas jaspsi]
MDIRTLTPNVSVSDQISADDVAAIQAMGFKAIVGNRPDGEGADQPDWAAIEQAAKAAGLATAYIPIAPGQMSDDQALAFRDAVTGFDKPVLAFCRTGTRSTQLWALAARDRLSTDEVIRMAATAGYDISAMHERLERGL